MVIIQCLSWRTFSKDVLVNKFANSLLQLGKVRDFLIKEKLADVLRAELSLVGRRTKPAAHCAAVTGLPLLG